MSDAFIIAPVRTPIGRYGGALSAVRADDLAAHVIRCAVERAGIPADRIDDVILGCANQAGEDNRNVARMAGLLAGLPVSVPGVTVNRLCGSGLQASDDAARLGLVVARAVSLDRRRRHLAAVEQPAGVQRQALARPLGARGSGQQRRDRQAGDQQPMNQ